MLNQMNSLIIYTVNFVKDAMNHSVTKLERGDADSGGSTLRTLGVVTMVVLVVAVIGTAILLKGTEARDFIASVDYSW